MTLTTGTKKDLVDFLWEWAEQNGDWSKLLVSLVINTEQDLKKEDRELIFGYFLQSIKFDKGLPDLNIIKPIYKPSSKKISIQSLSKVKGVNKLAENQTINFSKNITVVYGENGTGKTGYCRILKSLGFSYDNQNTIHSDINNAKTQRSASINYRKDDTDFEYSWTETSSNIDLSGISVFNDSCVKLSLNDGRNLIVSPIGFHLFNLEILMNQTT